MLIREAQHAITHTALGRQSTFLPEVQVYRRTWVLIRVDDDDESEREDENVDVDPATAHELATHS